MRRLPTAFSNQGCGPFFLTASPSARVSLQFANVHPTILVGWPSYSWFSWVIRIERMSIQNCKAQNNYCHVAIGTTSHIVKLNVQCLQHSEGSMGGTKRIINAPKEPEQGMLWCNCHQRNTPTRKGVNTDIDSSECACCVKQRTAWCSGMYIILVWCPGTRQIWWCAMSESEHTRTHTTKSKLFQNSCRSCMSLFPAWSGKNLQLPCNQATWDKKFLQEPNQAELKNRKLVLCPSALCDQLGTLKTPKRSKKKLHLYSFPANLSKTSSQKSFHNLHFKRFSGSFHDTRVIE